MERPSYLNQLIRKQHNGMIKVITGLRRSGKTYLLFELFDSYLEKQGISRDHIIKLAFDDRANIEFRNPDRLYQYVRQSVKDDSMYYVLLDEVQLVPEFEDVLNSFLHIRNVDTYVTGSNAKFLSKDIITEFRGRGDQIHLYPLNFSEFMRQYQGDKRDGWTVFTMYGGLPKVVLTNNENDKANYLKTVITETYIKDITERNKVLYPEELKELLNYLASGIGGLTNPKKLSDTFKSVKNKSLHQDTVAKYLGYFEDSFLVSKALRYDVKGKKYISTPSKYYFTDLGLRNAQLNFRQYEETHIMENVIYNELCTRGFSVDVGVVEQTVYGEEKKRYQKQLEVDFVCNLASKRIYVQSALAMPDREKELQEQNSLVKIKDAFTKIIIAKDSPTHYNEKGILILNLFDFLLGKNDDGVFKKN
ncbi:MAG: ATP-binding protein [Acidaminococcaceae bacterium]|nr:ATP-binding protein [Acidaminococcaceae bacterium]